MTPKLNKMNALFRDERLWVAIKERIRFRIYLPAIKSFNTFMDWYYGVETENIVELSELRLSSNIGARYESSPYLHISKILRSLKIGKKDVFVDMGCGKGRIMLIAGKYPLKRIIGVDISDELNSICSSNVQVMFKY